MNIKQLRNLLKNLPKTSEVCIKTGNCFSLISDIKYEHFDPPSQPTWVVMIYPCNKD